MAHLYSTNCACVACEDGRAVEWKKPKFTPGPWRILTDPETAVGTTKRIVAFGPHREVVSSAYVTEANARLIAAAPELLAVVQHAATAHDGPDFDLGSLVEQAVAALAKAGVL